MAASDPNAEWIGNVQPVGLVVAATAKAFIGSKIYGQGFIFDDVAAVKGEAETLEEMRALIESNPGNAKRIFPYIGGEEMNNDPEHKHHRYVIDFADFPLCRKQTEIPWTLMSEDQRNECVHEGIVPQDYPDPVAADWPDLLEIVERRVKPERQKLKENADARKRKRVWWLYGRAPRGLYTTTASLNWVLAANAGAAPHFVFGRLTTGTVYAHSLIIFAYSTFAPFAVLQSRIHEIWARFFSSSMKDDLRYTPSDCFRTFPFPEGFETDATLEAVGEAYHAFRAELMIDRNEGLTKIYNRFHARDENASDIARLREHHAEMDQAVLRAYGGHDLANRGAPEFIEQEADEGKKPKTRLDWPAEFKDEVLAKLLALNAERAAAERAAGIVSTSGDLDEGHEIDEQVDA
jgi:hypothetical protein